MTIPYGRQDITEEDIEAVVNVLRSDFLTQGPVIQVFENKVSEYAGSKHAIAVNSATSALHISCLALGLGPGDLLWTSVTSFVASANCAIYCGAKVDFVDIDPHTLNVSIVELEKKLKKAKIFGRLPKIFIAVHLCGQSCDMASIHKLSLEYNFKVIEDASHGIGGKYRDEYIGNCRYSDITIFSFHPVKIITTAEGGMALTNSDFLAKKMHLLRSHGITRDSAEMINISDGPWYYEQIMLGFNYRMTELQAALGVSQMQRLNSYVSRRHELAGRYDDLLRDLPVVTPVCSSEAYSALHLYVVRLELNKITKTRLEVFNDLKENGIGVNVHYIPIHLHPYYQKLGFKRGDFTEAEKYYSEAITLPMFPLMSEIQQDMIVNALSQALKI